MSKKSKKGKGKCPKVAAKIKEAERRREAGLCWCECVNDDIPAAKRKLREGNCGGANSTIQAALARCYKTLEEKMREETEAREFEFQPLDW